jgi:hypothetical protein
VLLGIYTGIVPIFLKVILTVTGALFPVLRIVLTDHTVPFGNVCVKLASLIIISPPVYAPVRSDGVIGSSDSRS